MDLYYRVSLLSISFETDISQKMQKDVKFGVTSDVGVNYYDALEVLLPYEGDLITAYKDYSYKKQTSLEIIAIVKALIEKVYDGPVVVRGFETSYIRIVAPGLSVLLSGLHLYLTTKSSGSISIQVTASLENTQGIIEACDKNLLPAKDVVVLDWWFKRGQEVEVKSITISPNPLPVHKEFYPFLPANDCHELMADYIDSSASILILTGAPGTGKTSLLRDTILRHKLRGIVTYDKELLESDRMFVKFITGTYNILIIEDADALLSSREHYGNQCMDRFLNVSSGLVSQQVKKKKIVLTTNTTDVAKIDEALVRRGRCYGILEFRTLSYEEAVVAAKVAGVKEPKDSHLEYSLADLLNQEDVGGKVRRVGFAA